MGYNLITGWAENESCELRYWAKINRRNGAWNYLWGKPLDQCTQMELAEVFTMYIGWVPEELLALSDKELEALVNILDIDPRTLSPLQLHQRYVAADAVSLVVGAIVREYDTRRFLE